MGKNLQLCYEPEPKGGSTLVQHLELILRSSSLYTKPLTDYDQATGLTPKPSAAGLGMQPLSVLPQSYRPATKYF